MGEGEGEGLVTLPNIASLSGNPLSDLGSVDLGSDAAAVESDPSVWCCFVICRFCSFSVVVFFCI